MGQGKRGKSSLLEQARKLHARMSAHERCPPQYPSICKCTSRTCTYIRIRTCTRTRACAWTCDATESARRLGHAQPCRNLDCKSACLVTSAGLDTHQHLCNGYRRVGLSVECCPAHTLSTKDLENKRKSGWVLRAETATVEP
eukprot:6209593-Pleurochrysis_carterae.AAC.4